MEALLRQLLDELENDTTTDELKLLRSVLVRFMKASLPAPIV